MPKFLLAVLVMALVSGVGRAEGLAGGDPPKPPPPEPGIVGQVAETVTYMALRLKGAILACNIRKGMEVTQAIEILGKPLFGFGVRCFPLREEYYEDLGVTLTYDRPHKVAGGGSGEVVTGIRLSPLFRGEP